MTHLRELFLLDPQVIFLNHGSFGATPRPVLEVYQDWQRRMERQPVQFLGIELMQHLDIARHALAVELQADPREVVFIPNATYGVNLVARSLPLRQGDEILASDHEYGACDNAWQFVCHKTGAIYRQQPISLPAPSQEEIVEAFWKGVTERTRVIFLSHIASPTAVRFPVEAICRRARQAGILTLIDGAHAPGQISLDLEKVGADFYAGNCHKWLCAPKGAGFLHVKAGVQDLVEPLVVSWGWGDNSPFDTGSAFLDSLQWPGTHDPCAFLSVPAAIQFQREHHWAAVRRACRTLLDQALLRINELTGLPPLYARPESPGGASASPQMGCAWLPAIEDIAAFKDQLYRGYRIEVPCVQWRDRQLLRLSIQGYNSPADVDALLDALAEILPAHIKTF